MAKSTALKNENWFKFYYQRILVSCKGWRDDEFGAYVKLLIHQFDNGFVPDDEKELKKIITSHKKNWQLLKKKFPEVEPGKLMNDVMRIVRDEFDLKKVKGKEYGLTGGRPKKENPTLSKKEPEGFKIERDNNSSSFSNSGCLEKEDCKEGKTFELSPDGFFSDAIDKNIELNEIQIGATIEFVRIKTKKILRESDVEDEWKAFKIIQFGKHDWYNGFEELLSHFRHSLKLENHKNGTAKSNSNTSATTRSVASLLSGTD